MDDKIKLYATAYNCGYTKPEALIRNAVNKKTFHMGWAQRENKYCYAEISVAFINNTHQDND